MLLHSDSTNIGQIANPKAGCARGAKTAQSTHWSCHDMIRTQILNWSSTWAKVVRTVKWNHSPGLTRPKTHGFMSGPVTIPPRQSGSGSWTGLEPNRTIFPVQTWTAGGLPGPVSNTSLHYPCISIRPPPAFPCQTKWRQGHEIDVTTTPIVTLQWIMGIYYCHIHCAISECIGNWKCTLCFGDLYYWYYCWCSSNHCCDFSTLR